MIDQPISSCAWNEEDADRPNKQAQGRLIRITW